MFDRFAWREDYYERYLLSLGDEEDLDDEGDLDAAEEAAYWADAEGRGHADYGEPAMGRLARMADDIEAGRVEPPPGWKLDRPDPGVQVWTTPSGRRYACDPAGELLPLPDGEAAFRVPD